MVGGAGAAGTRSEFNGDLAISDYVLQKGRLCLRLAKQRDEELSRLTGVTRTPVR